MKPEGRNVIEAEVKKDLLMEKKMFPQKGGDDGVFKLSKASKADGCDGVG